MYGQSSNCFTNKAAGVFHPGKYGHKKDGPKTVLIHIHQLELITQPLPRTWQYP